jgi:hypothetical protein
VGLFSRRERQAESATAPADPIPIDPASIDMDDARAVVSALCSAIGDDNRMWAATERLMAASGMPERGNAGATMAAYRSEGRHMTRKLWRWLVAVAEQANRVGAHDVAAMAYLWASEWVYSVEPTLSGNGHIQLGFDSAPPGTYAALVTEAEVAMRELPKDFVVAITSQPVTVTAGTLAPIVAEQVKAGGELSLNEAIMRVANSR